MSAFAALASRIARPEGVRRLGQALWMLAGQDVSRTDLAWAASLLGQGGDIQLWDALKECGVVSRDASELCPFRLSSFLGRIWATDAALADSQSRLVWTLPSSLHLPGIQNNGYSAAAEKTISQASTRLTIASPYLESRGVGQLQEALLAALHRGVDVRVFAHDIDDLSSQASYALAELARDAASLRGSLAVYTTATYPNVLLHLKVIVADSKAGVVGSANVTHRGLTHNLELGVILAAPEAAEIDHVLSQVLQYGVVKIAFSTSRALSCQNVSQPDADTSFVSQ